MKHDVKIELAIKLSRYIHNVCENVPHDIGLTLVNIIEKHEAVHNYREFERKEYDKNR